MIDLLSDSTATLLLIGFLTGLSTTLGAAAAHALLKWITRVKPEVGKDG